MSQVLPKSLLLPIAGLLCSSVNLSGQQSLGVLSGTITDATGAAVTNSTITLTSDQTGAVRNVTASRNGSYSFQALPIGTYSVSIATPGFNTEQIVHVPVQADRTATLPIKLKAGDVALSVDVTANPTLNTTDPTNGYVLDASTIQNIPLATGSSPSSPF